MTRRTRSASRRRSQPQQRQPTTNVSPRPPAKPRRTRRRKAPGPSRGVKPHHVAAVCSITDPFCPAAKNAKWPDGTSGSTMTEQLRGNVSLTSNATGDAVAVFVPGAPYGYMVASSITTPGRVATFPATLTAYKANTMLATYGNEFRIVSFGIIARVVASANTAAGVLTLGTASWNSNLLSATNYSMGTESYDNVALLAVQPGKEVSWISTPRGTDARAFAAQTPSNPSSGATDWTMLVIELSGAGNAVTSVMVEWFVNIEFNLPAQSAISSIARPGPPAVPAATTATSAVHSTVGSIIEGGVSTVEKTIAKYANDALSSFLDDPLDALAALFG